MYKMTTMYTYLIYPRDIFGSPNNYVKVKMVHGAMKIFFMKHTSHSFNITSIDANHYDFSVIVTNFGPKLRC